MNKVIYIGYQPITSKIYSDFYIDTCIDTGFEIEYWDISHLYFPKLDIGVQYNFADVKFLKSFRELKLLLSLVEIKSSIFIINITYEFRVWRLFILLSSFNCTLAFFGRGMFPIPDKAKTSKIKEVISTFDLVRMISWFKNRVAIMLKKYKIIKPYDYIFIAGSEGYKTIGFGYQIDLSKAKKININYFDYDKYLKSVNIVSEIKRKYCVYLDEYLPYHPDVSIMGIKTVTANNYYSNLNIFFDFIEKKFNTIVIIAAHPKAHNYKSENPFAGRRVIFNKTCELVKDAIFVMTHHSTSISFPVLFKKTIFFITSQAQKKTMYHHYETTLHIAKSLNCQVVHFDNIDEIEKLECFVDIEKYNDYTYKYLTSKESENKKSSKIFIETISQI